MVASGVGRARSIGEVLSTEGVFADAARGTSMLPLIREGLDTIVVAPCSAGDLVPMDVVLYEREGAEGDGTYVPHRVVASEAHGVLALGDNCTWLEEVSPSQVRGVLVGLYRPDGRANVLGTCRYRVYVALWCRPWRVRVALLGSFRRLRRRVGLALAGLRPR